MRKIFTTVIGYVGAALTLVVAVTVPFVLMGYFSSVLAHAGFHVDDGYTGGTVARTLQRSAYQVVVYEPVYPHLLQSREPFVQIAFRPVNALPERISEEVDLDGDGRPDVRIAFAVPADPRAALQADVNSLNDRYQSLSGVRKESFSRLIVRTNDAIVVRVPLSGVATKLK
jgi:hypothetical protein